MKAIIGAVVTILVSFSAFAESSLRLRVGDVNGDRLPITSVHTDSTNYAKGAVVLEGDQPGGALNSCAITEELARSRGFSLGEILLLARAGADFTCIGQTRNGEYRTFGFEIELSPLQTDRK